MESYRSKNAAQGWGHPREFKWIGDGPGDPPVPFKLNQPPHGQIFRFRTESWLKTLPSCSARQRRGRIVATRMRGKPPRRHLKNSSAQRPAAAGMGFWPDSRAATQFFFDGREALKDFPWRRSAMLRMVVGLRQHGGGAAGLADQEFGVAEHGGERCCVAGRISTM